MPERLQSPGCTVDVLKTAGALQALDAEWSALSGQQACSPALHLDWVRAWWQVYGPTYGRGLRVVTLRRGGRLIAALPLFERSTFPFGPRRLGFVSTGERESEETCPEYLDLLRLPGEDDACLPALAALLHSPAFEWDELDFVDVPADSPLCSLGKAFLPPVSVSIMARGDCPIAELSGGFDAYLRRLSSASRQQFRRLLKAAAAAGVALELAQSEAQVDEYFDQLIRLHQARWTAAGKRGCFAAARFTAFHRLLARRWVPDGRAVLAKLNHGGTPLALIYGFVSGRRFHFYQSGVRVDNTPVRYPGLVAHLLLMNELGRGGVEQYDFLRGGESYKERFATTARSLVRVQFAKPTLRAYCRGVLATGWRRSRRWLQPH